MYIAFSKDVFAIKLSTRKIPHKDPQVFFFEGFGFTNQKLRKREKNHINQMHTILVHKKIVDFDLSVIFPTFDLNSYR